MSADPSDVQRAQKRVADVLAVFKRASDSISTTTHDHEEAYAAILEKLRAMIAADPPATNDLSALYEECSTAPTGSPERGARFVVAGVLKDLQLLAPEVWRQAYLDHTIGSVQGVRAYYLELMERETGWEHALARTDEVLALLRTNPTDIEGIRNLAALLRSERDYHGSMLNYLYHVCEWIVKEVEA